MSNIERPEIRELPSEQIHFEADEANKPQLFEADSGEVHESPDNTLPASREIGFIHHVLEMPDTSRAPNHTNNVDNVQLK